MCKVESAMFTINYMQDLSNICIIIIREGEVLVQFSTFTMNPNHQSDHSPATPQ